MSKAIIIPEGNKDIRGVKEELSSTPPDKKDGAMGLISRLLRFDSLSKKSTPESPTSNEPPTTYYGVYIPCEVKKGSDEEVIHVYKNKSDALDLMKKYKTARFKMFNNKQQAVLFALKGAEPVDVHDGNENSLVGEKPYPFKAPSPQDMVTLRKAIEAGRACTVRDRVWENPRYLVSSGNTPAILQEGSRYNALHVAAKALNAEICNLILTTVGNPVFVQTLYGMDASADCCKEFASILVDRYLNTPDKAMNETPLHFAAKYGAEAAVDVLTSFPQCNKRAVNKFGEQPKDIICKRAASQPPDVVSRISNMLKDRFYVPVVHCEDDVSEPVIGQAFTPAEPPDLNRDPLSPRYEIRAFAGPMEAHDADKFRRKWKTPPRTAASPRFRLKEISKGLESVGRNLAEEMKVGWKEYWPFLDTFTDLRSKEGLALLENYLKSKYDAACSYAYSDSCMEQNSPDNLSISRISLNISQRTPNKDQTMSPISELCVAMKTCTLSNDRPPHWRKTDPIRQRLCRQPNLKNTLLNGDASPPTNHTVSQLLCIERTCQVFAKRISDALIFSLTAEPEVAGDYLKSEAKHLHNTMYTYMDDERFRNINFALIHCRLAQLVVFKLKQRTSDLDDINRLVEFLVKLRCPNDDIFSSDDERKPMYRGVHKLKTNVIETHVRCLSSFIAEELVENDVEKGPSVSESECADIWDKASKCNCDWKIDNFDRNSKKNVSFRKNRAMVAGESIVKRLTFDQDMGDGRIDVVENDKPLISNSPGGDSAATYTVQMDKCQVVQAEISSDESTNESDSDAYLTASEQDTIPDRDDVDVMHDASDAALAEPFIYGDEPNKMDRLVFDAISDCKITPEEYPSVYRWRHTVNLYSPSERDSWPSAPHPSPVPYVVSVCSSPRRRRRSVRDARSPLPSLLERTSTPTKTADVSINEHPATCVSLQVSNWLRVTGPNSPKTLATKGINHNASFGF